MDPATLRLKMVVGSVKRDVGQDGETFSEEISLTPVYSDQEGDPNKLWSKWTPSGQLNFTVNNPAAFGKVIPGQYFFVDLIRTEKDAK